MVVLGRNLVRKLLKKNYQVIVMTCFFIKKIFIDLLNNENLKLIKGDIRDLIKLETFLENSDIVIHLAYFK